MALLTDRFTDLYRDDYGSVLELPALYPGPAWRGRITLVVEAGRRGAAVGEAAWDSGLWSDGTELEPSTWSGLEPIWSVIEGCNVDGLQIRRGRFAGTDRFRAGTARASLTFELAEAAWSFRDSAPIQIGDEIRFRATVDAASPAPYGPFVLFRGTVRELEDRWTPGSRRLAVQISAVDRFAELAAVELAELEVAVGAGELVGERLERILEAAEIPAFYSSLAPSAVTVQETTLGGNLLDMAQRAAEADGGAALFVARDGTITFLASDWPSSRSRSTLTTLEWANVAKLPQPWAVVCPDGFTTGSTTDLLANHVTRGREGGSPITVRDEPSIIVYGLRTDHRLGMINDDDADVLAAAEHYLEQRSTRTRTVGPLSATLAPFATTEQLGALVDVDLLDRHRIEWDDGSGGAAVELECHVQSVSHTISPKLWQVEVGVWEITEV